MDTLATERQERLTALLDQLETFPTYAMLMRCVEAVGIDPRVQADRDRMDAAMAGAWAYDRMLLYLKRLRSLNEERMELGRAIYQRKQVPDPTSEAELEGAVQARVEATELAGEQEIVVNFFCVCVQHIHQLLTIVADAVGYQIPADDVAFLDEFRFLRNHFEHWNERLPGKNNEIGLMTKTLTANGYHVTGGLSTDQLGRFVVVDPRKKGGPQTHVVDVTNAGLTRIEQIMRETVEKVRERALDQVRVHFIVHPDEDIPSPESVRLDLPISAGSPTPPSPTTNPR